jgi:hypothetical protein
LKKREIITETLSDMGMEWTTNDYFVMPDTVLPPYPKDKDLQYGYYVLFVLVAGDWEMIINDVPTKIEPSCLYAFSPGNVVKPINQSPDCLIRVIAFTKDFLLKNSFKSKDLNEFLFFDNNGYVKISLSDEELFH